MESSASKTASRHTESKASKTQLQDGISKMDDDYDDENEMEKIMDNKIEMRMHA